MECCRWGKTFGTFFSLRFRNEKNTAKSFQTPYFWRKAAGAANQQPLRFIRRQTLHGLIEQFQALRGIEITSNHLKRNFSTGGQILLVYQDLLEQLDCVSRSRRLESAFICAGKSSQRLCGLLKIHGNHRNPGKC